MALQRVWVRAVLVAVVMMLAFGAIAVLVWIGGQDVLSGRTSAGELVAFYLLCLYRRWVRGCDLRGMDRSTASSGCHRALG